MAFERSLNGQSNRALFFGVDMVIYVEGGRETGTAVESYDGMFWKKVFQAVRPELRVRTIPKGSKRNLLDIATSLGGDTLGNVLIAIDRDYDDLFESNKNLPNVIKTFGYSYENDAFYCDNLESLFYDICPICEMSEPVTQFIKDSVSSFTKQMWWPQFADVCGYMASVAVLDRDHPQKYFTGSSYGSIPHLSMPALRSDIRKSNKVDRVEVKSAPLKFDMLPRVRTH